VLAGPGRRFWDPAALDTIPGLIRHDDRPGDAGNVYNSANVDEAGQVIYAYQSAWLPASLLEAASRDRLVDALTAAAGHSQVEIYFGKGLAGGRAEAIDATGDTAMNPAVLDAFALAICGAGGPPAYPGIPGYEPDESKARRDAAAVTRAMSEIRKLTPRVGSYVWETEFFEPNWQDSFWGDNYARLRAIKRKYDSDGLFFLHHGVGSEEWSADGFTRLN